MIDLLESVLELLSQFCHFGLEILVELFEPRAKRQLIEVNLNERRHVLSHVCQVGLELLAYLILHLARLSLDLVLRLERFLEVVLSTLESSRHLITERSLRLLDVRNLTLVLRILLVEFLRALLHPGFHFVRLRLDLGLDARDVVGDLATPQLEVAVPRFRGVAHSDKFTVERVVVALELRHLGTQLVEHLFLLLVTVSKFIEILPRPMLYHAYLYEFIAQLIDLLGLSHVTGCQRVGLALQCGQRRVHALFVRRKLLVQLFLERVESGVKQGTERILQLLFDVLNLCVEAQRYGLEQLLALVVLLFYQIGRFSLHDFHGLLEVGAETPDHVLADRAIIFQLVVVAVITQL